MPAVEQQERTTGSTVPTAGGRRPRTGIDAGAVRAAVVLAFRKLDPRHLWRSPVMFVVWIGSVVTTVEAIRQPSLFSVSTAGWLWLTVWFGNVAEAVAEGRGRAQAATLRAARTETLARRLDAEDRETEVASSDLRPGDRVRVSAGQVVPGDGEVIVGVASVDESAITGESAPVIREAGGDRSAVTGGTTVLSDEIVVRITAAAGDSFLDRMIALVEGSNRRKTPNELALSVLLSGLTIMLLLAVATVQPMARYAGQEQPVVILVALLICLIPTTISALLSAIGIAGMDRLVRRNVLAMSGRAVEAAGDVSTLLLDKTGTITYGNRQAAAFVPAPGITPARLRDAALLSSLADLTPEGRSVVSLARAQGGEVDGAPSTATYVEFSAQTRMSGVDLPMADGTQEIRKGAGSAVAGWLGLPLDPIAAAIEEISAAGGTPLVVAERRVGVPGATGAGVEGAILGVIHLKDVVKPGMRERFAELRTMGIKTVMITGDNPLTARAIAAEAGVDDFLAEATPEDKLDLIHAEQARGAMVAMTGDGTNDAPALAAADVGVAMNSGTAAAKEAGNMVDLDSDPTKLIDIVRVGKQMLITRGALTTFSIANDIAKYFAIIPAMFAAGYPGLQALNITRLSSPTSAVLSAVIFNAVIIVILIPLALRGVRYRPASAGQLLRRNLTWYGIGGILLPFVGIKIIDLFVSLLPGIG